MSVELPQDGEAHEHDERDEVDYQSGQGAIMVEIIAVLKIESLCIQVGH